jgi:DMATS type aromatic prenyltransferase
MAPAALINTLVDSHESVQEGSEFWSNILTPQINTLLEAAKYSSHEDLAQDIRKLLHQYRALGPQPNSTLPWPSFLSDDHSPIEYSVSIAPDRMIVRFAFEPISKASGTLKDPYNSVTTTKWLTEATQKYPYDLS